MDTQAKKATREDLWRISQFFKTNFMGEGRYGTMDVFTWKAFENPTDKGFVNFIEIDGDVASTTSITPKILKLNNKSIPSAEIGDTYTSRKYFRKGLFTIVANDARQKAEDQGIEYIYGLPNSQAFPGWIKRANFVKQSSLNVRDLSVPLSAQRKLRKLIGWHGAELLAGSYRIFARTFLGLKSPRISNKTDYTTEECTSLPEDWSLFWKEAADKYDFIIDRDQAPFHWRYLNHPEKYKLITLRYKGALVGYTVHKTIPTDLGQSLVIADYLFHPDHENGLNFCLDQIFNYAFTTSTRAINIWCEKSSPYYNIFCHRGFKDNSEIPVILYANNISPEVAQIKNAHFTMGDSDNV
ncbi:MAG: GNAT family N-acetyltransferase [Halopseudomonas aestusnigri]